jgi:hypothetical protein
VTGSRASCAGAAVAMFFGASVVKAEQPEPLHRISVFAEGGPVLIDLVTDGHGPRVGKTAVGAGASYLLGRRWGRVGLGLRYDFVPGGETNWSTHETETAHLLSTPVLGALVLPISSAGDEVHLVAGVGPSWGWLLAQPPEYVEDGTTLRVRGFSLEAMLGYAHPIGPAADLVGEAGVRIDPIRALNGTAYFQDAVGGYGGIFVRAGVRFEL